MTEPTKNMIDTLEKLRMATLLSNQINNRASLGDIIHKLNVNQKFVYKFSNKLIDEKIIIKDYEKNSGGGRGRTIVVYEVIDNDKLKNEINKVFP